MIHTETKFAYLHKPTGKWVELNHTFDQDLWDADKYPYIIEMRLVDSISEATLEWREFILTADLKESHYIENGEKYAADNFLEFEIKRIKIEYSYEDI